MLKTSSVLILGVSFLAVGAAAPSPLMSPDGRGSAALFGSVAVLAPTQGPPASLSAYATRRYRPPAAPGTAGGPEDAVIYLVRRDVSAKAPAPEARTVLQRDRTIHPHVTVARTGDPVLFPNDDDVYHNLFSLSDGNGFNLGRYAPGLTPEHTFTQAGTVRLFCDIHAEMAGVILVIEADRFTSPDTQGAFRFDDVAPGTYDVVSWHPSTAPDTATVTLSDGASMELDFRLRPPR